MKIAIIGLGYVGLPLAVQAAEKGHQVLGIDFNQSLLDIIQKRKSPYVNDERFESAIAKIGNNLEVTNAYDRLVDFDNIIICVPTPTENNVPDTGYVRGAASQIAPFLRKGHFVSIESTVNPGITRGQVLPILEDSGLKVGEDFFLAHCPERINPGDKKWFVGNLNRVVGGMTVACTDAAVRLYQSVIDAKIIPLGSTEEAEFVKSWENSQRNVMIAMANSAAIIADAMDMNIDNIKRGLESKIEQFGLTLAEPGIGPGGHCIPEDIHFVIGEARRQGIDTRFLDDAAELNDRMPRYAVHRLSKMMTKNGEKLSSLRVALLGLAYKPNVADARRSPSIEVAYLLARQAGGVVLHDEYIKDEEVSIPGVVKVSTLEDALDQVDAVFIGTAHAQYLEALTPQMLESHGIRYVLDGRNALDLEAFAKSKITYRGIGR